MVSSGMGCGLWKMSDGGAKVNKYTWKRKDTAKEMQYVEHIRNVVQGLTRVCSTHLKGAKERASANKTPTLDFMFSFEE